MVFVSRETLKKTAKKRSNVSCETLYKHAFICIFIQIKGVKFCGIQTHKLYTNTQNAYNSIYCIQGTHCIHLHTLYICIQLHYTSYCIQVYITSRCIQSC